MPEPVRDRKPFRLTVERPTVPASVRRPFLLASLAVVSSWSIGGVFFSLSLGPELGASLFHTSNVVLAAVGIAALAGAAALAQLLLGRTAPWIGTSAGSLALAAGTGLVVAAAATGSAAAYLVGSVVGGVGFGVAFLGGLRALAVAIPPDHRASVLSAFYVVAYAALSVPAILAGVVVSHVSVTTTFELFGAAVSALALIVAAEAWRTRPSARQAGS
jgi:hypothetical protein